MEITLQWAPRAEFDRVRATVLDPHARSRAWSTLSRLNTLTMVMRAGSGHLGSSFSAADIVGWLMLEEMQHPFLPGGDLYFSSKGHDVPGLYAALIGAGLLPESALHTLRRLGGLPGHPDVHTPHMPFCTGSLGMGISKAKGLTLGNRLRGSGQRVYVLTGDGELQEGQNWESLRGAVHHAMSELTVIVDHNKLQSDTWVSDVNDLGDIVGRFAASGWAALRCDGHDPAALEETLARRWAEHGDLPAVIVADTVKGYGADTFASTSMGADEWRYLHHSGAPSAEDYRIALSQLRDDVDAVLTAAGGRPLELAEDVIVRMPAPPATTLPEVYGEALAALAAVDGDIVALDADLLLDTGLIPFREQHPDRFVECGIAEQDMVSMASGLARQGWLPFVHSFSCFLHARPYEQIYNNACEGRRIVYTGALAGLVPGAPGHSHQAVRDVSAMASVPGMVVVEPAGPAQTRALVHWASTCASSVYLRLVSSPCSEEVLALPAAPLREGCGDVLREGGRVVVLTSGPVMVTQVLRAVDRLGPDAGVGVVNLPWLNRVDAAWLASVTAAAEHLLVVENHVLRGGQGDVVAAALTDQAASGRPVPLLHRRAIGHDEIPRCGTPDEVLRAHGLHEEQLAALLAGIAGVELVDPQDDASRPGADRLPQFSPQ